MKTIAKMLYVAVAAALTLSACHKDKVVYNEPDKPATENVGYLLLGDMQASVMEDTENIGTRAEAYDINEFDVTITNSAGELVESFKYKDRPTEAITLPVGVYQLNVSSGTMSGAEWETPVYGATKEVKILSKVTEHIETIVCRLQNIKVTVEYAADLAELLDFTHTNMVVALEESQLTYANKEARAGYFAPIAETNTLKLTFTCRYTGEEKNITMTNEITGVKACQWRKITVAIQNATDGSATIGIVCDTWTYDEEITFDTSFALMEEPLADDTDLPEINWEGHDLATPFEISDDMFNEEGVFTSSINLDIAAKSPIASIVIKASSTNTDFMTNYTKFIAAECDICDGSTDDSFLKIMGYPIDALGATSTRLQFAKQVDSFKEYPGTHTFEIVVTDDKGNKNSTTLTVKYGSAGSDVPPSIVWDGYDITQRQTYAPGMTCELTVTAENSIKDLRVQIVSNDLTPEELAGVGLASEFSLVNDDQYFGSLGSLGFPTGEAVKGKKELNLSITTFLSILSGYPGDHDFVIEVTDNSDLTSTETIMLHFDQQ